MRFFSNISTIPFQDTWYTGPGITYHFFNATRIKMVGVVVFCFVFRLIDCLNPFKIFLEWQEKLIQRQRVNRMTKWKSGNKPKEKNRFGTENKLDI